MSRVDRVVVAPLVGVANALVGGRLSTLTTGDFEAPKPPAPHGERNELSEFCVSASSFPVRSRHARAASLIGDLGSAPDVNASSELPICRHCLNTFVSTSLQSP